EPIIDISNVIISTQKFSPIITLNDLKGYTVAITKNNALHEYIKTTFPEIKIKEVKDDLEALQSVSFKQADATVVNLAIASYLIDLHGITNLKMVGDSGRKNPLAIAIRSDYPILRNILDKALKSISKKEHDKIYEKWIKVKIERFALSKDFWIAVSISGFIIIIIFVFIIFWNYRLIVEIEQKSIELKNELIERTRKEEELFKSEQRYKELIELAADAILIGDQTGVIISANTKACELTGYTTSELLGKNITILFKKEVLEAKPLRYDLLKKGEVVRIQRNLLRNDGKEIIVEMNTKMMPDLTYQSIIRDITEAKKKEFEIKNANDKLLSVIDELKSVDEVKNNIIANISHELRTPLVSIRGYIELLLNKKFGEINEIQKNYLQRILKSIDRLVSIIENLIFYSRLELNKEKLNYSQFDIYKLIEEAINLLYPNTLEKNISIKIINQQVPLVVNADRDKLFQVLLNLLSNALKFSKDDSVIEIEVKLNNELKVLIVSIIDSGIGIPEDKIPKIFEKFYQVDASLTRQFGGLGLGLSICKNIIEMHKGKITAKNRPEGGAIFTFTIPINL
ncbi:MAG TPA: ATP-binding protein, partial [bacterium]|nr:ATP-binding protein [bacterium]